MTIIFVGLSNKIDKTPLDSDTLSGSLVDKIIKKFSEPCLKVNLVNFAPKDLSGKLRYPNKNEMDKGYVNLKGVMANNSPCLLVCLGDKVFNYLKGKENNLIKIKHPAYIGVYKRKYIENYIDESVEIINSKK